MSVPLLNRLLMGMQGTFTPEEAQHFTDYHIEECDYETLCLVADHTSFTQAERREFFELTDWMANPEFAPEEARPVSAKPGGGKGKPAKGNPSIAKGLVAAMVAVVGILAAVAFGIVAIVGVVALIVIALVAAGASGQGGSSEDKYPDMRSDYNRRVWADDHSWEADGDTDHNYEADGDYPW